MFGKTGGILISLYKIFSQDCIPFLRIRILSLKQFIPREHVHKFLILPLLERAFPESIELIIAPLRQDDDTGQTRDKWIYS